MKSLEPCPCGKVPTKLDICYAGQGGKYATATGDCCGEWMIEYRTQYFDIANDKCMELAIKAWNGTPRGKELEVTE